MWGSIWAVSGWVEPAQRPVLDTSMAHMGIAVDEVHDTLRLLVLLPFGLQVDTVMGGELPRKAGRLREIALECLQGVEVAAHQLAQVGLPLEVKVVDETPDSLGKMQVTNMDIARCDVVLGPLMRENLAVVAPTIDRYQKNQILLTEQPERMVQRGSRIRQAVSSELVAAELLAEQVAAAHDTDNVMMVMTQGSDLGLELAFQRTFDAAQRSKWQTEGDSMRYALLDTVHGTVRSVGHLADRLTPYERNVVVSVAGRSSRSMWAALQTALQMNDSSDIVLYGSAELAEMPFVEGGLMEKWRLTLPQTGMLAWNDSTKKEVFKLYRTIAETDPQKYGRLAHDAVIELGKWTHPWTAEHVETLSEEMTWRQSQEDGAWLNASWTLTRFKDLSWGMLDTMPLIPRFEPRLFMDEEDNVIPVPEQYQHLFPEEYPKITTEDGSE